MQIQGLKRACGSHGRQSQLITEWESACWKKIFCICFVNTNYKMLKDIRSRVAQLFSLFDPLCQAVEQIIVLTFSNHPEHHYDDWDVKTQLCIVGVECLQNVKSDTDKYIGSRYDVGHHSIYSRVTQTDTLPCLSLSCLHQALQDSIRHNPVADRQSRTSRRLQCCTANLSTVSRCKLQQRQIY